MTDLTEEGCKRKLRALRRQIIAETAQSVDPRMTIKRWADEWIEVQATRLRPKAFATLEGHVDNWIIPTIGNRRLRELTAADARAIDAAHARAGNSPTTARTCRRTLHKMLTDAVAEGHNVPPAILNVPMPRQGTNSRSAIGVDDMVALIATAMRPDTWPPLPTDATPAARKQRSMAEKMDATRWLAALLQGMRQGECLGLTWDRVDLEAGTITIDRQMQAMPRRARDAGTVDAAWYGAEHVDGAYYLVPVKSAAGARVLPIVPALAEQMRRWRDECPESPWGLVWPRLGGGPWSSGDDRMAWRGLQDAAGVHKGGAGTKSDPWDYWVVHEARHSAASLLMSMGTPTAVVIAIMGHAAITTTLRYEHAALEDSRRALAGVAGLLQIEG